MTPAKGPLGLRLNVLEILRPWRIHVVRIGFGTTSGADKRTVNASFTPWARVSLPALQDRALAVLVAGSTEVMRRFAIAHRFLQRVHHAPGKGRYQFVALLLSFPVFHASNLAFKLAYTLNQRRLRRICGEDLMLRSDKLLVEFDSLGLNLGRNPMLDRMINIESSIVVAILVLAVLAWVFS
jgi:hypothetical protein